MEVSERLFTDEVRVETWSCLAGLADDDHGFDLARFGLSEMEQRVGKGEGHVKSDQHETQNGHNSDIAFAAEPHSELAFVNLSG